MQVSETNAMQTQIKILFDNPMHDYYSRIDSDYLQSAIEDNIVGAMLYPGVGDCDTPKVQCKAVQVLNDDGSIALVLGDQKLGYNRL